MRTARGVRGAADDGEENSARDVQMRVCVRAGLLAYLFKHKLHMSDRAAVAQSIAPLCSVEHGTSSRADPSSRHVSWSTGEWAERGAVALTRLLMREQDDRRLTQLQKIRKFEWHISNMRTEEIAITA